MSDRGSSDKGPDGVSGAPSDRDSAPSVRHRSSPVSGPAEDAGATDLLRRADPCEFDLSFDIFQRYAAVAHLIQASAGNMAERRLRVLDVGSGSDDFLRRFLPEARFEVYFLDKGMSPERARELHFVRGDAVCLPFTAGFFDMTCSIDLLEHLLPADRCRAIDEMVRVTRGAVVIAAPCAEDGVAFYEQLANSVYKAYFGEDNKWLAEHRDLNLPREGDILEYMRRRHGCRGRVFPNGHLPRWSQMIAFNLILRRTQSLADYAALVSRFYNQHLYDYDNRGPCYRRVFLLGGPDHVTLPCREEDADYQEHYAQLRQFVQLGYEMLGILPSIRAAGGVREVKEALEDDLSRTRAEASELRTELSRVRAEGQQAERRASELRAELSRVRAEGQQAERRASELRTELSRVRAEGQQAERRAADLLRDLAASRNESEAALREAGARLSESEAELSSLRGEAGRLQSELEEQNRQTAKARAVAQRQEARVRRVLASRTYRAGQVVLFPFTLARAALRAGARTSLRPGLGKDAARVVQYTPTDPQNPYYTVTLRALERLGWSVACQDDTEAILRRIRREADARFLVLFHQFDPYIHPARGRSGRERADALMRDMRQIKRAGGALVWTLHNYLPHDATSEEVEQELRLRRFVRTHFDAVIVLNEAGRAEARRFFPDDMIALVPHVSFKDVHGPRVSREEARSRFGYPKDAFFFGSFGAIRPYKGLELVIDAFRDIGQDEARLLIVGGAKDQDYVHSLRRRAGEDCRVIIRAGPAVPSADIPIWLGAMDVAVFGFTSILTSGSVILALSYGLPVIAPNVGGISEVVIHEENGLLYEDNSADSLRQAMQSTVGHPLLPHMQYMARPSLDEVSADNVARQMQEVFARVLDVSRS